MKNALNLTSNLAAFVFTFGISFLLTPYIVRTLGVEANGLIGLTNNFVSYASILGIALGSVTARFVTLELENENQQKAGEYYTAAYANTLIGAAVVIPVMIVVIAYMDVLLNVPSHLVGDAQVLAALLFASFLIQLVFPAWRVGTWATNNLYLDSIRDMQSVLLRGGAILVLFATLEPSVAFVGVATLSAGLFAITFAGYYKRRLLPELKVRPALFHWGRARELLAAGFWNSVNYLGTLATTAFHLLLANLFIGATAMGLLALAMMIPAMVNQLAINLSRVFLPSLAFAYAKADHRALQRMTNRAMSITSMLTMIPLAALIVFGDSFFALWVPSEDAAVLNLMSIAAAAGLVLTCSAQPLQTIFMITNSQRGHSIASVSLGVVNILTSIALLTVTSWGVYAILASGAATAFIRVLIFTAPMAGRLVNGTSSSFMLEISRSLGYLAVLVGAGLVVRLAWAPSSWISLVLTVGIMATSGSLVNLLGLASRGDRKLVVDLARRIFR